MKSHALRMLALSTQQSHVVCAPWTDAPIIRGLARPDASSTPSPLGQLICHEAFSGGRTGGRRVYSQTRGSCERSEALKWCVSSTLRSTRSRVVCSSVCQLTCVTDRAHATVRREARMWWRVRALCELCHNEKRVHERGGECEHCVSCATTRRECTNAVESAGTV
jgi:hypothetical protein